MLADGLFVHFASPRAADAIRGETAAAVHEMQGRAVSRLALLNDLTAALELPESPAPGWDSFEGCLERSAGPLVLLVNDSGALWTALPDEMRTLVETWNAVATERGGLHLVFVI